MVVPFFLLALSLAGIAGTMIFPAYGNLMLVAVASAVASLVLLLDALWRRRPRRRYALKQRRPRRMRASAQYVIVDGSNVMHWRDNTPRIETVREVVQRLDALGYVPGVVFDANAGYKLSDRYLHDYALGRMLGLPADRVLVVQKGTPADPTILAAARQMSARVVTNDRFRDWAEAHPEVEREGHLVRGGYVEGRLWLDLGEALP